MSYCLYKWLMPEMLCLESPYSLAKEIASLKVPLMNKSRALFPNLDNTSEFLSCKYFKDHMGILFFFGRVFVRMDGTGGRPAARMVLYENCQF